jgi:Fe2+ or Zn2+ uptake regulation protein
MNPTYEEFQKELMKKNIKLSYQRLKVLAYLIRNRCHPTVDQIFTDLHRDIPTLSRTTVYNTVRILADAALVRVITIEDNETRYDIDVNNHGHFKCESCGTIFNFNIDIDAFTSDDLKSFKICDKNVYFKGICPDCLSTDK